MKMSKMGICKKVGMGVLVAALLCAPFTNLPISATETTNTDKVTQKSDGDNTVKVAIKTSGYGSVYHSAISVTSDNAYTLSNGKKTKNYRAKKKVTVRTSNGMLKNGQSIWVMPAGAGKTKITSITRSMGTPSYAGKLEIKNVSGKGLVVINHVDIEDYLYGVVGSEMSSSFAGEALKAQAVAARSFALSSVNSSTYANIGADFDDSTSYQVYNNTTEDSKIKSAVDSTKGQVVKANQKVVKTYFFSTSFGKTALPSELWGGTEVDSAYNSEGQTEEAKADLSDNEEFESFLEDTDETGWEAKQDWYRWSATISAGNMTKQVNRKLKTCYFSYPSSFKVKDKKGNWVSKSISGVGKVKSVTVTERAASGLVQEIEIVGGSGSVRIHNSNAIRMVMAPYYDKLVKKNGSTVSKLCNLPSGFFAIESNDKGGFILQGGGYGHGVGMSQNGANAMAKAGEDYKTILLHYFKNVDIS